MIDFIEEKMLLEYKSLKLDQILFFGKDAILFTGISDSNEPYLFLRIYADGDKIIWLATKTSYQILIQLLEDKLTIADAFLLGDVLKYIISLTKNGLTTKTISRHTFPEKYLPTANEYLDVEEGEYKDVVETFKGRIDKKVIA